MILWRVLRDAGQVAQLVVSLHRPATAVGAGQAVLEIAVRYVAALAPVPVIKLAQSSAITIVRTNVLDVNGLAQMIARQDAKRIAFRHAQQIVRTPVQTVQADAETVAFRLAQMIAQADARAVAIRHAQRIA